MRVANVMSPAIAGNIPTGSPSPGADPNGPKPTNADVRDEFVKTMISSPGFVDGAMKNLSGGKSVTVQYDGKDLLKITSEGPSAADNLIHGMQKGVRALADGVNQYAETDPLLALRLATASLKATVNNCASPEIIAMSDNYLIPMVRAATLVVDIPQAIKTFRAKDSTPIDKGIEVLHLGTDVAGMVGAVAPFMSHFAPGLAHLSTPLLAASFAGDALTCGYRALVFARKVNPQGSMIGSNATAS